MPQRNWARAGVIATIVVGAAAVLIPLLLDGASKVRVGTGGGFVCDGGNNSSVTCYQQFATDLDEKTDRQLRHEGEQYRDNPPQGAGPWPFVVVDTAQLGLKIRTSGDENGRQVGSLANRNVAWVTCKQWTDFEPDPTTGVGPLWYAIKWPSNTSGMEFYNSEPTAQYVQWAYAGFLVPLGHNGNVPDCP